jgi:hypothetical protein
VYVLKVGDQVAVDWNFQERQGVGERTGLYANMVEIRLTDGPLTGRTVRVPADMVRPDPSGGEPPIAPG